MVKTTKAISNLTKILSLTSLAVIVHAHEPRTDNESGYFLALACGGCHGQQRSNQRIFPDIHGINELEFIKIINEFKSDERAATIMNRIAKGYSDDEIKKLAIFFAHRPRAETH